MEINKSMAMAAYHRHFNKGKTVISENFLKAYKLNKAYFIVFKNKRKIGILIFGSGDNKICLNSETFKMISNIDISAAEILFKGDEK